MLFPYSYWARRLAELLMLQMPRFDTAGCWYGSFTKLAGPSMLQDEKVFFFSFEIQDAESLASPEK